MHDPRGLAGKRGSRSSRRREAWPGSCIVDHQGRRFGVGMSLALFLLLLSVPLGVLVTVTPSWVLGDPGERIALTTSRTPVSAEDEPECDVDSSDHPATCLAVATHRAHAYLAFIGARWH